MKVMHKGQWLDGFLPYYSADGIRVKVLRWIVLAEIHDLYFIHKKNWRLILNYIREIGLLGVVKKIRSRRSEALRNDKYFSVGWGLVMDDTNKTEKYVAFLAYCHPLCVDELVVPIEMTTSLDSPECWGQINKNEIKYYDGRGYLHFPDAFKSVVGWSSYSGISVEPLFKSLQSELCNFLLSVDWGKASIFRFDSIAPRYVKNRPSLYEKKLSDKPSAVIFGYGQYAKTIIIPNVRTEVEIKKIYEVDPLQIPRQRGLMNWSTSPVPEGDDVDVYFIAGYHHTHAPLAEYAIRNGAVAVVEKPVVVDGKQLQSLIDCVSQFGGRLYSSYHKRFSVLNQFARKDLNVTSGDAINYHCIVHEVPLPPQHWYNWPNSHSRIVSNGCHWLDHFLYLNNYAKPIHIDGFLGRDGTLNCSVLTDNGALFSMVLTDRGSSRIGVQDYIELRKDNVTVKIQNGSHYFAENTTKILRKLTVNKLHAYADMYKTIAKDLAQGALCDSLHSLLINNSLMIELERIVHH